MTGDGFSWKNHPELTEKIASLIHEEWMEWAKNILTSENISQQRRDRWIVLFAPYEDLPENMKEQDRVWARKVLSVVSGGSVVVTRQQLTEMLKNQNWGTITADVLGQVLEDLGLLVVRRDVLLKRSRSHKNDRRRTPTMP